MVNGKSHGHIMRDFLKLTNFSLQLMRSDEPQNEILTKVY